jgi:dienelactone hydrolase
MKYFFLSCLLLVLWACTKGEALSDSISLDATPNVKTVQCDTCQYPIVMVHGFLASGDTYTKFHQLFTSNGYKHQLLFAFDWNSLSQNANHVAALDAFIDKVLAKTGASKVRLMGHSAGGGLGYNYLNNATRAAKVDAYVHIASSPQSGPAGPANNTVPTLNLWSQGDKIVMGADIPGATNVELDNKDHYQVATSKESFAAVYAFFHGQAPATLDIIPQGPLVCIAGKVLTFGENTPLLNAKVEIFEVDPTNGQRLTNDPFETHLSDSLGFWGPTNVKANTTYEFKVTSANAPDREIHYFREHIVRLNSFVYLRTIPPPPSLAGFLLAGLPNSSTQTVLNMFSGSQAVVTGRDTLTVAGSILSTPQYASPEKTAIDYFLYDDGDGMTELNPVGLFGTFSFLNGVDMFFPTATPAAIPLQLNGRVLNVRNIKSSEGIVVAVFD